MPTMYYYEPKFKAWYFVAVWPDLSTARADAEARLKSAKTVGVKIHYRLIGDEQANSRVEIPKADMPIGIDYK